MNADDIDTSYDIIDKDEIEIGELPIYSDKEVNKIIKLNHENIIIFDMNNYLSNIWKSYYHKKDEIIRQFNVDFPRHCIYINNILIDNIDMFNKQLHNFRLKRCMDLVVEDLQLLTIMLCNQSSFELPFHLLHQIYTNEEEQIFLTYQRGSSNIVRINAFPTYISFIFETTLRIIDIRNSKVLYIVPIKLLFDIPDIANKIELGIFNWQLVDENKILT